MNRQTETCHRRTGVTDGLHFVHVVVVDDVVEGGVELVEEVHHLVGRAGAGQLGEAYDVTVREAGRMGLFLWYRHR